MTLEKLVSGFKKGVGIFGLASALLLSSGKASAYDDYTYFAETSKVARGGADTPPRRGYVNGINISGKTEIAVSPIGSYREKIERPEAGAAKDILDIRTKFSLQKDPEGKYEFNINYERKLTKAERTGFEVLQAFREDTGNTSVYLAIPKEVKIERLIQKVSGISHKTGKDIELLAIPFEDTKASRFLEKINKVFEAINNASLEEDEVKLKEEKKSLNEMDRTAMNLIGLLPEGTEQITSESYDFLKSFVQKHKEREVQEIKDILFKNYTLFEIPEHVPNGNPFKYTSLGRDTRITLDATALAKEAKGFVFIPSIGFTRTLNGSTETASIDGLAYEFTLSPHKK